MRKIVLICVSVIGIFSLNKCGNSSRKGTANPQAGIAAMGSPRYSGDNSANSLDWPGTYQGTLPCADCEGILTEITLAKDNSYFITTTYLGRSGRQVQNKGDFSWNAAGKNIILIGLNNQPSQYKVGENKLISLDLAGTTITGALAEKYVLHKQVATAYQTTEITPAPLVETYWKLKTLMGKSIDPPAQGQKEIHIILKQSGNRIQGFAGCNTITGTYELKRGNRLSFKNVVTTMMACRDMTQEDAFKKVLLQADNFTINEDKLSLNRAKMAPLAIFEAVYLR